MTPGHRDRLIVGDLTSLPSDATYPVVVGIQVFQHGNRAEAHEHIRQAQRRVAAGGLFALRVNAIGTDVYPAHEIIEHWNDEGFTVRYVEGSKAGLGVHFFAKTELKRLFVSDFHVVPRMAWFGPDECGPYPESTVLSDREALVRVGPPGRDEAEPNPDGERPGGPDVMQRPRKTVDPARVPRPTERGRLAGALSPCVVRESR